MKNLSYRQSRILHILDGGPARIEWIAGAIFCRGPAPTPDDIKSVRGSLARLEKRGLVVKIYGHPVRGRKPQRWALSEKGAEVLHP